jgi:hypothetical protein
MLKALLPYIPTTKVGGFTACFGKELEKILIILETVALQ